ncbi:unnamed protein product [Parnassius mnemosyne]|uniref:Endonuclease/exonuclease/phosphatase domain-containing protein n=1 Tax=Parnassius mnemosyne TaxID=213953 RepID=A0AAV1LJ36_9NEOP
MQQCSCCLSADVIKLVNDVKTTIKTNTHTQTKIQAPQTGQLQQNKQQQANSLPSRLVPAGVLDHYLPTKRCEVLHIATLNTRTLRTHESLLELEKSLENIKYDILGICEMRRLGEKIEDHGSYILYHKGETAGCRGVGFLIKQLLRTCIQELIGISDRLAILNVKLPGYKKPWSIIQAYAPTENSDLSVLEAFYYKISLAIKNNTDKHIILMGDFNAQIGARQNNSEYVLGKFGHGKRSRNGQKLVEFLMEHNLSALNTNFNKNKYNKWTWISPDGSYKNEIDYIITNYPRAFTDTTVISNLNFNTNHRMVRCSLRKFQTKISRNHIKNNMIKLPSQPCLMKCNPFKETNEHITSDEIETTLKYDILENELQSLYISKNYAHKPNKYQLSEHTLQLIGERKELIAIQAKKENIKLVADLSKRIRESIRKDRKVKRLKTFEHYIQKKGGVKKALKELREVGKEWIPKLKDKSNTTTIRQNIKDLATSFYRQLYARQHQITIGHHRRVLTQHIDEGKSEPVPDILLCEVEKAIKSQKMEKSPGPDKITNELMRGNIEELTPILTKIFNEILTNDLVLIEERPENLEYMINNLNEESIKAGLKMNTNKTKIMTNSTKSNITINGDSLEYVKDYIYLGQVISIENQIPKEINLRIATGWKKYWSLKEIVKSKDLSMSIKRKTFNTCILPCLTYGCETWTLTKALREKLAVAQRAMERSMTGYKRQDKIRNIDLRNLTKLTDILERIDQQKWRWSGHMVRDKMGKWSRRVTEWYPRDSKRRRGRQHTRWEDEIRLTAGPNWRRVAQDRQQWKSLEEAFANRHAELRDIL